MVLFPYTPMSELVWSQTEGVGIRYTSESEFGKVSLFWSTESFNIVIPSTNTLTEEDRMDLYVNSEMASGRNIAGLFGANKSLSDVLPVSIVRRQARESRSCSQINFTDVLGPVHAQVRVLAENFEKDEESANSSVKKSAKVSNEKEPANDGMCMSTFQPLSSYQENFKGNDQIASSFSLGFLHENLQDPKLTIKGKEKVVCEKEDAANGSDDSNESVESTGSIVSKRKSQWLSSNKLNDSGMKNKRLKTEGNESSFMNWISAISNGFGSSSRPASVTPLAVAKQQQTDEKGPSSSSHMLYDNHSSLVPIKPMGFSSLFNSLYRQNVTISSNGSKQEAFSLKKSNQIEDDYDLNENRTESTQDQIGPKNQNEGKSCALQTTVQLSSASNNESRSSEEKRSRNTNGGNLESFWITRLLSKEASTSQPPPIENDAIDQNKEPNDCFDEKTDQKLKTKLDLILPSSRNKESEAIVSLFAKRLGAIRHAKPLNISNCKNQGNIEEEKMECFGSPNNDRRMVPWLGDQDTSTANEANKARNIGLIEVQSSSAEKCGTGRNSALPNPNSSAQGANEDAIAIFEAVRRLRLSRTDVVRWLKTQIQQATLDGFFLRLRLGNLKEAVGRSGYCVARINGLSGERHLSVSIGNLSCLVECHCISNQDFLEDELKAWFTAGLKDGFRLPSKEELDRKLKERNLVVKN